MGRAWYPEPGGLEDPTGSLLEQGAMAPGHGMHFLCIVAGGWSLSTFRVQSGWETLSSQDSLTLRLPTTYPATVFSKALPKCGEGCSEITTACSWMAKDIERGCYLFQAQSQRAPKNIERRYFIVQPVCSL